MKQHSNKTILYLTFLSLAVMLFSDEVRKPSNYFPTFYHLFNPVSGGYSNYEFTSENGEKTNLTFGIVGREGSSIVLEMAGQMTGRKQILQFLVNGDPIQDENISRIIIQNEGEKPILLTTKTLNNLKNTSEITSGGIIVTVEVEGGEVLDNQKKPKEGTSFAGNIGPIEGKIEILDYVNISLGKKPLKCRHLLLHGTDGRDADILCTESIIPFGIVKLTSGKESIELKDWGLGYGTKIKGNPQPLELINGKE